MDSHRRRAAYSHERPRARLGQLDKIVFPLEPVAWHSHSREALWAELASPGLYRLLNSPFYAYGVSLDDVVAAKYEGPDLIFSGVSQRAGHSTYRVFSTVARIDLARAWRSLAALECTYEGTGGELYAVDVPPSADLYEVYSALEAGERDGEWTFEEAHCGHHLRGS